MKLKKLEIKNFGRVVDAEIVFPENSSVLHIVGPNRSGKTTMGLTALWVGFHSIAQKGRDYLIGERFRFIGSQGKAADIHITLIDETKGGAEIILKRHITKDTSQLSFEAPEGYLVDETWLKNLLNVSFLSAKHFERLSGKEQALKLGIDTSEFDYKAEVLKDEAKIVRAAVNSYGTLQPVEKVDKVNIGDLITEKEIMVEFNAKQKEKQSEIGMIESGIGYAKEEIEEIEMRLMEKKRQLGLLEAKLKASPKPEPMKPTLEISEKIQGAEAINQKAAEYERYVFRKTGKDAKEEELQKNLDSQKGIAAARLEYIKGFNFGVPGLSVDESGNLIYNNKPVRQPYCSRSEIEYLAARLYASTDPELKVRFIDDFEGFDPENGEKLIKELLEKGFQVITASVGREKKNENTLLLNECKIVDSFVKKI